MSSEPNLFRDLGQAIPRPLKLLVLLALVALVGVKIARGVSEFGADFRKLGALSSALERELGATPGVRLNWTGGERILTVALPVFPDDPRSVAQTVNHFASAELHDVDTVVLCAPTAHGQICEQI